jgi:hypothetical protein
MDLFFILISGISIILFIIPFIILNLSFHSVKKKILLDIRKYKNIQNFIDITKERLEIANRIFIFSATLFITSFFAMQIFDFASLLRYSFFGIAFVFLMSAFICVNSLYLDILILLYKEKDKREKI